MAECLTSRFATPAPPVPHRAPPPPQLEVRAAATGEVLFRDQLPKAVAHIAVADLRSDSTRQILVCLVTGELRGYVALEAVAMSAPARSAHDMHVLQQARSHAQCGNAKPGAATRAERSTSRDRACGRAARWLQVLADLQQRKRELSQESHLLGQSLRAEGAAAAAIHDVVPPDTAIAHALSADPAAMALELMLETNNACVIKGVVLFAEQLFDGESLFVPAARPARRLAVRLSPQTDKPVDMLLKVRRSVRCRWGRSAEGCPLALLRSRTGGQRGRRGGPGV